MSLVFRPLANLGTGKTLPNGPKTRGTLDGWTDLHLHITEDKNSIISHSHLDKS